MAKKKITYDVFVRVIAPENVDPNKITQALHNEAIRHGWDFAATIEEEMGDDMLNMDDLVLEDDR